MANPDLIDFNVIEDHKENIQALPSGRSAKALAALYSPPLTTTAASSSSTPLPKDQHSEARSEFESELLLIDEADDPLDIYDRYVKWTLDTYPSAQSTPQSQLLPLLERATRAFLSSQTYLNDARYLKLWLHYIRFFSDAPRETFLFLSRNGVGESLALFYEEYAAWLENAGRWTQAEQVYKAGIEKNAHPTARLMRKFGDFERRKDALPEDVKEPGSPALPAARPALAAKVDPFSAAAEPGPQQTSRPTTTTKKPKAGKMAIFTDDAATAADSPSALGAKDGGKGWDSIGSIASRKKENTTEAKPWAGETLKTGKTNAGVEKMMVFRSSSNSAYNSSAPPLFPSRRQKRPAYESSNHEYQRSINPKSGRTECVFVNLDAVYPNPRNPSVEWSFEELRAGYRRHLDIDWSKVPREDKETNDRKESAQQPQQRQILPPSQSPPRNTQPKGFSIFQDDTTAAAAAATGVEGQQAPESFNDQEYIEPSSQRQQQRIDIFQEDAENQPQQSHRLHASENNNNNNERPPAISIDSSFKVVPLRDENDENRPPTQRDADIAKRLRREERANRTRKIKVMEKEVQNETQTVKLKTASPTGQKVKRKRVAEPTMTINTKEAMEEIYGIFSQPVKTEEEQESAVSETESDDDDDDSDDDDDDDYTSAGESTGTGHLSAAASDYGDETRREILASQEKAEQEQEQDEMEAKSDAEVDDDEDDKTDVSAWSDYTVSKAALAAQQSERDDENEGDDQDFDSPTIRRQDMVKTPHEGEEEVEEEEEDEEPKTRYIPLPPEDYEPRTGTYRDPVIVANNRLPFMTPIVEQTEVSLGLTGRRHKDSFSAKTPSRQIHSGDLEEEEDLIPTIDEDDQDGPWSSPFQDILKGVAEDKRKILKPIRTKTTKGIVSLGGDGEDSPQAKPLGRGIAKNNDKEAATLAAPSKGPIIKDPQVNPVDPELRNSILAQVRPPLSSYDGYHEHLDETSGRVPEIRKYAKAVAKTGGKGSGSASDNRTVVSLAVAPILSFEGTDSTYTLKRELGAGAFAPVYLVENSAVAAIEDGSGNENQEEEVSVAQMGRGAFSSVQRHRLEAVKMEDPPSVWEFYMIRQAHRRLGVHRATESIVHAYEMHVFRDEGFLVEEFRSQGTLLDLVNIARADSAGAMEETLAMFFAVELVRTVEQLHKHGVIHGDLKGDNVLVRFDDLCADGSSNSSNAWSSQYQRDGSNGWNKKGVTLIDFGRGIDVRVFAPGVQFVADWPTTSGDCAEMREMRPWTYQVDYHGLAGLLHSLLFGKYMSTVAEKGAGVGGGIGGSASGKTYRIRESLKRYWQTGIWGRVFGMLLNPLAHMGAEEGGRMPLLKGLREVREEMEEWLSANCERGIGLKTMIRKMEEAVKARGARR